MFESSGVLLWFPATCGRPPESSVGYRHIVLNKLRPTEDLSKLGYNLRRSRAVLNNVVLIIAKMRID